MDNFLVLIYLVPFKVANTTMFSYNLAVEYSAFVVLIAILFSFLKDEDTKSLKYKYIKLLYLANLASVLSTILSTELTTDGLKCPIWLGYSVTMLYYLLMPSIGLGTLLYCMSVMDTSPLEEKNYAKILAPAYVPYIIHVIAIFWGNTQDLIFKITPTQGYVRGPFYYIPFVTLGAYIFVMLVVMIKNIRIPQNRDTVGVLFCTTTCAIIAGAVQILVPTILFTGMGNTVVVLIIHLYIQNISKSTDNLTGILNRTSLTHRIDDYLYKKKEFSLYILSLRNFKIINKRHGLDIGDAVLQEVAQQLLGKFGLRNTFRYAGDEFAILLENNKLLDEPELVNMCNNFEQSKLMKNKNINIEFICARVDYPVFGTTSKDLTLAADYSLKNLKENNTGDKWIHDFSVIEAMFNSYQTLERLKQAIDNNGFVVHYQPIYSGSLKSYVQAEALVRMKGDDGKLIFPGDFIEIAENTGIIVQITYIVLEIVCKDLRCLIDSNKLNIHFESVSINFPYLQFNSPSMVDDVMNILNKYNIPPKMIKIEITERMLISDTPHLKVAMDDMMARGFVFELDDFGVDYSNMSVFLELPLDIIKVDKSLLLSVLKSGENLSFFEYLVSGIKVKNRIVLVEGIEERSQYETCLEAGCELFQGYYFSKPVPFEIFRELIC